MTAIPTEDDDLKAPPPKTSDPSRLAKEIRREVRFGAAIDAAAEEAATRTLRAKQGPPPTEAELAILAQSPHKPVELFTEILVTDLTYGEQITYTLVPDGEGDPERNRISLGSPIGRTLFREYPGAVVEIKTPGGKLLYRILRVQ